MNARESLSSYKATCLSIGIFSYSGYVATVLPDLSVQLQLTV